MPVLNVMRYLLILLLSACGLAVHAQYGGSYTYAYLQLAPSARMSALGGLNVSTPGETDVAMGYMNPALLNAQMDGAVSVNHAFLPTGAQHGYAAYGKSIWNGKATMGGGLLYRSYGTFSMTDPSGVNLGSFKANEYALAWGIGYGEGKLRYGANVKVLYSQLESYTSFGMAADIGMSYIDTARLFSTGLVMRNIGTQFSGYLPNQTEALPFSIDLGVSQRLRHLPLRVSFTLHDLQTFDIRYDDPNAVEDVNIFSTDTVVEEKNYTVDKIAQHLMIGGEFYFGKSLTARVGYDHMTRSEMAIETRRGLTGFSLGFGLAIKKFRLDYGHEFTSLAGGTHHITLAANVHTILK